MENAAKINPEAYAVIQEVVRAAWALVDNTGCHDWLPLAVNRDDWNDLAARLETLKAMIPPEELPADPPHAVACFWPALQPQPIGERPTVSTGELHQPPKPQST